MKYQYTVHEQTRAYQGFFTVDRYNVSYEKFSGGNIENVIRECGKKGDIVAVLPYDPVTDEIIMVEQFRIGMVVRGVHPWTQEVVAGFMDVEGESAEKTASRELVEETGCPSLAMYPLRSYYSGPGGSASQVHIFVAEVDAKQVQKHTGLEDEGEDICVHRIPREQMMEKLATYKIDNATAIIVLQQFFTENWAEKVATLSTRI